MVTDGFAQGFQNERFSIRSPEQLHISNGRLLSYGASQLWYGSWFRRMAGCGPTAASNLIWYLAATKPAVCRRLCDRDCTKRSNMLELMNRVWRYVTPGLRGVDKAPTMVEGVIRFGNEREAPLAYRLLEIPEATAERPDEEAVFAFLSHAFQEDLPVAFLNLSSGEVGNLESWHWVMLVAVDRLLKAEIYDQGLRKMIDLALWLRTTVGGGALVTFEPTLYNTMSPGL